MSSLEKLTGPTLIWLAELGIGYYPVNEQPYDAAYWERYRGYDNSPMGAALTNARVSFVLDNVDQFDPLNTVDIGIGGGRFVLEMGCLGTDVNPVALRWLRDNGRQWEEKPVQVMTFWDSLEHIHDLEPLLAKVREWVFVSMPIYDSADHIVRSKHFRKDEHCWYFTHAGFLLFMEQHGFEYVQCSHFESDLGREDIASYAFRRAP